MTNKHDDPVKQFSGQRVQTTEPSPSHLTYVECERRVRRGRGGGGFCAFISHIKVVVGSLS